MKRLGWDRARPEGSTLPGLERAARAFSEGALRCSLREGRRSSR